MPEIDGLVETFYTAFTSGPGLDARLDALPGVFLPQAVIVRTGVGDPAVYDVAGFIAPRRALLTGGALREFREWEVSARTDVAGDVAHRFSSYAKAGVQDGGPFSARGTKTLQFVRTTGGWLISALAWYDEPGPA